MKTHASIVLISLSHYTLEKISPVTAPARAASSKKIRRPTFLPKSESPLVKTRPWPLTVAAAIAAIALLATPAEAGGKKRHHHHDWNDGGYTYYHRGWNARLRRLSALLSARLLLPAALLRSSLHYDRGPRSRVSIRIPLRRFSGLIANAARIRRSGWTEVCGRLACGD